MPRVVVIDYGIGNVLNVCRALEACGAEVALTDSREQVERAERLVLPGVGAFADGMKKLIERGLPEPVRAFAATGRPFLGICLGMQMMLDSSEEFGHHAGLGLVGGKVVAIAPFGADGKHHKVPHMGWNQIAPPPRGPAGWAGTILESLAPGAHVYFVHSYTAVPDDPAARLADCDYDGVTISAAIARNNLYGCQFHPEKSGPAGLSVLERFLRM